MHVVCLEFELELHLQLELELIEVRDDDFEAGQLERSSSFPRSLAGQFNNNNYY